VKSAIRGLSSVLAPEAAVPKPDPIDASLPSAGAAGAVPAPPRRLFAPGANRPLFAGLAVLVLAGLALSGLEKATKGISCHALETALRGTPASALLLALAATAVSYAALFGYDLSGLRYARARPPIASVLLASFCGYAIGNAVGFGAFSGGAVRYRIYTAAGLSPGQIARVVLFISAALGIGLATIAGLGLVLCVHRVSGMLGTSPEPLFAAAATLLSSAVIFLLLCAVRRRPLTVGPIVVDMPGPTLVLTQIGLTTTDVLAAAAVLWVLLPPTHIGFVAFAAVYAAALGLGVLSHIPGGLGVFDVAILYAVGGQAPVSAVAAALVVYRAVYYLLPLFLSTILLAGFETRRFLEPAIGARVGRAASRLAPPFLAATTFAVGATLVASGATPAFTDRLQVLAIHVPLWAVETAHLLASVGGLALLFAARGLLHRLDGAWWLALSMALLSIPLCLVKGLAIVAPTAAALLLIGLLSSRRQFDRRASLLSQPLTAGWLTAIGCVGAATIWILFFAFRHVEYRHQLWWQFEFDASQSRALRSVLGVAMFGLTFGVWQLLRPAAGRPGRPLAPELAQAQRVAAGQKRPDALLALIGDKSLLFSETGKSFLMFARHGRTWATLGDPVGPYDEWAELVWRFIELADAHLGRVAFYQVPPASLPLYLDAGLRVMKIGEEACVPLPEFTLEGGARAGLRYALRRGERDGLAVEVVPPERVAELIDELEDISNAWLAQHATSGEKRFSVAAFRRDYVTAQTVALLREHGRPVAFATVMTTDPAEEATLGLMRMRPDTLSRCAMEYLFVRLLFHFRGQGYRNLSLGMTPLSGFGAYPLACGWHRIARFLWSHGRRFYNFQGLHAFKGKFAPVWEPRYLVASGAFGPYFALADIAALIGGGIRRRIAPRRPAIKPRRQPIGVGVVSLTLAMCCLAAHPAQAFDSGDFGQLHVVRPDGAMHGLVVLFSDAKGWNAASDKTAEALARDGALVAGVDLSTYFKEIGPGHNTCSDAVSTIELISRELQRQRGNSTYWTPILAGAGEGGAFAAATLAQAPPATIAGAVSLDPTANLQMPVPPCPNKSSAAATGGFSYGPWRSLNGFWVAGFDGAGDLAGRARITELKAQDTPITIEDVTGEGAPEAGMAALVRPYLGKSRDVASPAIAGLPLIALPAMPHGPLLAIVFSGDGGWRDLDRSIAEKIRSEGVSVVGWDSLRYFWSRKTPAQTARDLGAVIDTYSARWGAAKVALIGYSFGAGVLPFAYDRLPPEAKRRVVQLSLLGFASTADFEISMLGWLGAPPTKNALPTRPALASIDPSMIQCFYGRDEGESLCPSLAKADKAEVIETGGGHHFDGDYDALAERILAGFRRRAG
jgi:phosphatidylglycerol lysyltransferase